MTCIMDGRRGAIGSSSVRLVTCLLWGMRTVPFSFLRHLFSERSGPPVVGSTPRASEMLRGRCAQIPHARWPAIHCMGLHMSHVTCTHCSTALLLRTNAYQYSHATVTLSLVFLQTPAIW